MIAERASAHRKNHVSSNENFLLVRQTQNPIAAIRETRKTGCVYSLFGLRCASMAAIALQVCLVLN